MEDAGATPATAWPLHTNSTSTKEGQALARTQDFKVQALSQLDAIAEDGLRADNAELTTMAWARYQ